MLEYFANLWYGPTRRRNRVLRVVPSPMQFRKVLERERARTDRDGVPFSLVTFAVRDAETAEEAFVALAKILGRRLRRTDEFGWLDRKRLAAVLPATPYEGALKVAGDVCHAFPRQWHPLRCEIFCYPSDRLPIVSSPRWQRRHGIPRRAMEPLFFRPISWPNRVLDILVAGAGLALLAPLLLVVGVIVKLTSAGPVLFRQERAGIGGRPFVLYKFRSMVVDAEAKKETLQYLNERDGPAFKIRRDPRVTRVGPFLRRTCIDELPQLWNVLVGDMTLVGPRPLPCKESALCEVWQRRRLDVTPGLTCLWQVHGSLRTTFDEWVRMDLQYVDGRSLAADVRLIFRTVPAVLFGRGRC